MIEIKCRLCGEVFKGKLFGDAYDELGKHWEKVHPDYPVFTLAGDKKETAGSKKEVNYEE